MEKQVQSTEASVEQALFTLLFAEHYPPDFSPTIRLEITEKRDADEDTIDTRTVTFYSVTDEGQRVRIGKKLAEEALKRDIWVDVNQWHDNITAIFNYDEVKTEDRGDDWPPKDDALE